MTNDFIFVHICTSSLVSCTFCRPFWHWKWFSCHWYQCMTIYHCYRLHLCMCSLILFCKSTFNGLWNKNGKFGCDFFSFQKCPLQRPDSDSEPMNSVIKKPCLAVRFTPWASTAEWIWKFTFFTKFDCGWFSIAWNLPNGSFSILWSIG